MQDTTDIDQHADGGKNPDGTGPIGHVELTAGELIHIDAGGWGLTWIVRSDGDLGQVDIGFDAHSATAEYPDFLYPVPYSIWGEQNPFRQGALRVTHHDGTMTTRMSAHSRHQLNCEDGEHHVITSTDEMFDLTVEHHLRTHVSGVLEQWVEIEHAEPGSIRLGDYDSIGLSLLVSENTDICQFGGSGWGDEWRWTNFSPAVGTTMLTSLGGVQPHLQRSPYLMISPTGAGSETDGDVIGMAIAWGGNTRFVLDVRPRSDPDAPWDLRLGAGANPYGAEYVLDPGVRFRTPTVAWTWAHGRRQMTDRFHEWTRQRVIRDPSRRRALVANNWEATEFDFDQARIERLIRESAELGAEVFLLDDGWFAEKYPRDDDTAGLGDWEVNSAKLPGGLEQLTRVADEAGIRFGIWLEPEMVNPRSELHERHPDWVVRDVREPREYRNQLLLDPMRQEVAEFEFDVFERTLDSAPDISYIKWDANRTVIDPGTATLAADRQANLHVDQVWATWSLMERVATAHQDVEMMLCASGGGRNDHGTMRYFHEFWTSDNTDPVTRIRMQWAASHFFPPAAIAAHVTRWGARPLGFAATVALSGRFGIDLDLEQLNDSEAAILRHAFEMADRIQDIVQRGELRRLVSPVDGPDRSRACVAHVQSDTGRCVMFMFQIDDRDEPPEPLTLDWIEPDLLYRVRRTNLDAVDADTINTDAVDADTLDTNTGNPMTEEVVSGSELLAGHIRWTLSNALSAMIIEVDPEPPTKS